MSCRLTKEQKWQLLFDKNWESLSQKVEGDVCHLAALLVNAVLTKGFAGSTWFDKCGMLVTEVDN